MKPLSNEQKVQEEEYRFPYHYLDLYSDYYRRFPYRSSYSIIKIVKELLGPFEGQSILDAGCGDGRLCYELRNENAKVVGVDYSKKAIAFAKAFNAQGDFRVADLGYLDFVEKFDCITLVETLEHIPLDNVPKVVSNLWKVLKDDGRLIVTVPTVNVQVATKHYQHFTQETLENLFAPLFEPTRRIGHARINKSGKLWIWLRRFGVLLWPLRRRLPCILRLLDYIDLYYVKAVELCSVEEAADLIVVFKKNACAVK